MRILIWHGYLLSGSGSNLYTANTARLWRAQGHDVLLMCQQRQASAFEFIDAQGDFASDNSDYTLRVTGAREARGTCGVARPNIGEILPVYVYDAYEGFNAKLFVDLNDDELDRYTTANVDALVTAINRHEPDAIITGHEVMGPFIALEACRAMGKKYLAKLHGSALEYAVKKQERYARYAAQGLSGADVVVGGSRYMIDEAARHIPGWRDRAVVVNPGCDIDLFGPAPRPPDGPTTIGYVGKFIASKGVHNFLTALGATSRGDIRVTVVGYGGLDKELRALWSALSRGDKGEMARLAAQGDGKPFPHMKLFLESGGVDDAYFKRAGSIPLEFTGRLDHPELAGVLPQFRVLVVPSELPEAFGMVAAEAAASGVLPVVPRHSGIGEVGLALERALGMDDFLSYDPAAPIEGIAAAIDRIMELTEAERSAMEATVVATARRLWSWERVAGSLLGHATGAL